LNRQGAKAAKAGSIFQDRILVIIATWRFNSAGLVDDGHGDRDILIAYGGRRQRYGVPVRDRRQRGQGRHVREDRAGERSEAH